MKKTYIIALVIFLLVIGVGAFLLLKEDEQDTSKQLGSSEVEVELESTLFYEPGVDIVRKYSISFVKPTTESKYEAKEGILKIWDDAYEMQIRFPIEAYGNELESEVDIVKVNTRYGEVHRINLRSILPNEEFEELFGVGDVFSYFGHYGDCSPEGEICTGPAIIDMDEGVFEASCKVEKNDLDSPMICDSIIEKIKIEFLGIEYRENEMDTESEEFGLDIGERKTVEVRTLAGMGYLPGEEEFHKFNISFETVADGMGYEVEKNELMITHPDFRMSISFPFDGQGESYDKKLPVEEFQTENLDNIFRLSTKDFLNYSEEEHIRLFGNKDVYFYHHFYGEGVECSFWQPQPISCLGAAIINNATIGCYVQPGDTEAPKLCDELMKTLEVDLISVVKPDGSERKVENFNFDPEGYGFELDFEVELEEDVTVDRTNEDDEFPRIVISGDDFKIHFQLPPHGEEYEYVNVSEIFFTNVGEIRRANIGGSLADPEKVYYFSDDLEGECSMPGLSNPCGLSGIIIDLGIDNNPSFHAYCEPKNDPGLASCDEIIMTMNVHSTIND